MPEPDLDAVRDRYCRALDAKPGKGPITHVDWLTDSVCDIPALLDFIHHLATDGGNGAAAYWLRAHDAERQRDEAEAEADRLRGLLAEAEKGRADAWDQGEKSGEAFERSRWQWSAGEMSRIVNGLTEYPERPANPYRTGDL